MVDSDAISKEHDASTAEAAQQAVERMGAGVISLGPEETVLFANARALEMVGLRLQQVRGRRLVEVFPHLRDGDFIDRVRAARESGEEAEYEEFVPRVGRWLRRRLYPSNDGVTVLIDEGRLSARELPDLKLRESQERAEAAERRYRRLLDEMGEGFAETTAEGAFVAVNDSFARMLGYEDASQLLFEVQRSQDLYVNPGQRSVAVSRLARSAVQTIEAQMRRRGGEVVWIRARVTPMLDAAGDLMSCRALVEDITAEREAERERRETEERIAARERKLLAEAVHDDSLQLVVAAMLRLESLQREAPSSMHRPLEDVVSVLEQTVHRLRELIIALTPAELSTGLVEALRSLSAQTFAGTGTRVDVQGAVGESLSADVEATAYRILREAVFNVRRHAAAEHMWISLGTEGHRLLAVVRDDGRGGAAPSTEPGHLGLATMAERAVGLGGELTVTSQVMSGTEVILALPLASAVR